MEKQKIDRMANENRQRIEERYQVSERGLATASELSAKFGIPAKVIAEIFEPQEWHHTQVYHSHRSDAMPTDFYDTQQVADVVNKNYDSDYYSKDEIDNMYARLQEAISRYKEEQQHANDVVEKINGYFGYCNYDGSDAHWYAGTAEFHHNGWWYLPDGKRKKKIYILDKKEFERKKNKKIYS